MSGRPRIVCRRPDGFWSQKRLDADRAASVHPAQREALEAAGTTLRHSDGGELITTLEGGQIRANDAVRPGVDQFLPKV